MSVFLAVTPAEAASCRGYRVPLVHIAYAVGDGGRLLRSELPRGAQGGLLGLSDRCNGPLPELPMLCRAILGECHAHRFGGVLADCQRLAMDFVLPCRSGEGTPLTPEELSARRERCGAAVFFSEELCANYFSYTAQGRAHFVLFDTAETLRCKLRLGRERGMETAFLMYPEVSDLLPELLNA